MSDNYPGFSVIERIILSNQFHILAEVDPDNSKEYLKKATILEQGFEGQYGAIYGRFVENRLSAEDCRLVEKTLLLHSWLMDWKDKANIDISDFSQVEFDGNGESEHLSYARFLYEERPSGYPGVTGVVNGHRPSLHRWRVMVKAWEERDHSTKTEADVSRILAAGFDGQE